MSFLESQAKAGYYPTPPELLPSIAAFVNPTPKGGCLLDPCCGKGEAAAFLAKAWNLEAYGIEINHARAVEASILLEQVIEDDYAAVTASHNSSVLFLNPPYDYSESAGRRLEYEFLRLHVSRFLPHPPAASSSTAPNWIGRLRQRKPWSAACGPPANGRSSTWQ